MTGNTDFPAPWPSGVPSLAQITTDLAAFSTALAATSGGDRGQIQQRNAARQTLSSDLQQLALYLQIVANGNTAQLATTGYNLRTRTPRVAVTEPLPAPSNLRLTRGIVSGELVAQVKRMSKAAGYDVQLSSGDPTNAASWKDVGTYTSARHIALTGLTPGQTYSVRLRAINAAGPGAWTTPASLMVV